MEIFKERAVILKTTRFKDRDLILQVLFESKGRHGVLARNSVNAKRFMGSLEIFTLGEWRIRTPNLDRELWFLEETHLVKAYSNLPLSYPKYCLGTCINEILLHLTAEDESASNHLFRLYLNAMEALSSSSMSEGSFEASEDPLTQQILWFLSIFLGKVLQWYGAFPSLSRCLQCQTMISTLEPTTKVFFPIGRHSPGWYCPSCAHSMRSLNPVECSFVHAYLNHLNESIRTVLQSSENKLTQDSLRLFYEWIYEFFFHTIPGFKVNSKFPLESLEQLSKLTVFNAQR